VARWGGSCATLAAVSDVTIRPERASADDHAAIAEVVESAFGSASVAELVAAIRRSEQFVPELSLVAEREGKVVGHVMVSFAEVRDGGHGERIAMLSPLAVAPTEQRRGIGALLVGAVTARAAELGERVVVLEGSPDYYGGLGFGPAADLGLTLPLPSWATPEAAQVIRLAAEGPYPRGTVVYPPAFDIVAED
jgi:putative acetyltransferase